MKTKLAIFDVDGTLYNGTLGIAFLTHLIKNNIFDKKIGEEIYDWHSKYKNGTVEKSKAVDEMYYLYAKGIMGKNYFDIEKIAQIVWQDQKINMFDFVPSLFQALRSKNFTIVILTGGAVEMASLLSQDLGVTNDYLIAGQPEIIDGKYSGRILSYPGSSEQKVKALHKLIIKQNIDVDWEQSLGMGDDERDSGILGLVGNPIAINPSPILEQVAKDKKWSIVNSNNVLETINRL